MNKRQEKKQRMEPEEIVRSFAFTVSHQFHGGNQYESVSFFASQKAYCYPGDDVDKAARAVRTACKKDVVVAAREHIADLRNGEWERGIDPHPLAKANAAAFERAQQRQVPGPRNHASVDTALTGAGMARTMAGSEVEHNDAYRK